MMTTLGICFLFGSIATYLVSSTTPVPPMITKPLTAVAILYAICSVMAFAAPMVLNWGIMMVTIGTIYTGAVWLLHVHFLILSDKVRAVSESQFWRWFAPAMLMVIVMLYIFYAKPAHGYYGL